MGIVCADSKVAAKAAINFLGRRSLTVARPLFAYGLIRSSPTQAEPIFLRSAPLTYGPLTMRIFEGLPPPKPPAWYIAPELHRIACVVRSLMRINAVYKYTKSRSFSDLNRNPP